MIKKLFNKILATLSRCTSLTYISWLKKQGVVIGEGTYIYPHNALIDVSRPSLVKIGKNCFLNQHFTLLTHDYVSKVLIETGRQFINSSGRVTIGDNVSFGQHVMVLKGVTIGDNSFIGAGSIVTKDIPANSVAVGAPCRVVMTIEEYYQKRLQRSEEEALDYLRSISERFHRKPMLKEMSEEFIWFVSGDQVDNYPMIPIKEQLGPIYKIYVEQHKAKYGSFEEFLAAAGIK